MAPFNPKFRSFEILEKLIITQRYNSLFLTKLSNNLRQLEYDQFR